MDLAAEEVSLRVEEIGRKLESMQFGDDDHAVNISAGCLRYQARILEGSYCGYQSLAIRIIEADRELGREWSCASSMTTNFVDLKEKGFLDIVEILLTIPNIQEFSMLQMMLKGELGRYLFNNALGSVPRRPTFRDADPNLLRFRPVIYVLLHCDNTGIPPTKTQYLHILGRMKYYLDNSSARGHENRDLYAQRIDFAGCNNLPGLPQDRNWTPDPNDSRHDKSRSAPHPRRYSYIVPKVKSIKEFITGFEKRLSRIPAERADDPIPWYLIYVGWTCSFERRQTEHYRHDVGQDIKNLIETIAFVEYPAQRFFMQMFPVVNVSSPQMVRAEHVISILAASYSCYGGFNGTPGGKRSDLSNAQRLNELCWIAGNGAIIQEGVMASNLADYKLQMKCDHWVSGLVKGWNLIGQYRRELEAAKITLEKASARESEARRGLMDSIIKYIVRGLGKWRILDDELDYLRKANTLEEDWRAFAIGNLGGIVDTGMGMTKDPVADSAESGDTRDGTTRDAPPETEAAEKHPTTSSVATGRNHGLPNIARRTPREHEVDLYGDDEHASDRAARSARERDIRMQEPQQQGNTMRLDQSTQPRDAIPQQGSAQKDEPMQQDGPVQPEDFIQQGARTLQGQTSSSALASTEVPPPIPDRASENTSATITSTFSGSIIGSTRRFMFPDEERIHVGPKEQGKKGRQKELTESGLNPYTIQSISDIDKKASARFRPNNAAYNRARPTQCFMSMSSPSKWPNRLALPTGLGSEGARNALAPLWEDPFSECPECVWRRSNAKDKDGNLSETGIQCFYFLGETKLRLLPRAGGEEVSRGPDDGVGVANVPAIVVASPGAGPFHSRAAVGQEEGVGGEGVEEEGVGEEEAVDEEAQADSNDEAAWMGPISGPRQGPRRRM